MADEQEQQQKNFEQEQAHGREVLAEQTKEIEESKTATEEKKTAEAQEAEEAESREWEEAEWATRLAAAKSVAMNDKAKGGKDANPQDTAKLLKKIAPIDKKIKEEMKKTGTEYYMVYYFLTVLAASTDAVGVVCSLSIYIAWINLILGPFCGALLWLGIRYADRGINDRKALIKNALTVTASGALSSLGVPLRTAMMLSQFAYRKLLAKQANDAISKMNAARMKILGPELQQLFPPPHYLKKVQVQR